MGCIPSSDISEPQVPKPKTAIGKFSELKLIDLINLKRFGAKSLCSYIPVIETINKNTIKRAIKIVALKKKFVFCFKNVFFSIESKIIWPILQSN